MFVYIILYINRLFGFSSACMRLEIITNHGTAKSGSSISLLLEASGLGNLITSSRREHEVLFLKKFQTSSSSTPCWLKNSEHCAGFTQSLLNSSNKFSTLTNHDPDVTTSENIRMIFSRYLVFKLTSGNGGVTIWDWADMELYHFWGYHVVVEFYHSIQRFPRRG